MALEELRTIRLEKIKRLIKMGANPYPPKSWRTHNIGQVISDFDGLSADRKTIVLAGRILAIREHGGSTFVDLDDGSGAIQLYFKKDALGEKEYQVFSETVDIGDFIETSGLLFKTKKNERTLEAERYRLLTKSLLPLPEKWHGLQDVEERFRKRYLDLIFNPDVRQRFVLRSRIIMELRSFLNSRDFMEVQTPTLQSLYGGATARPFKTHMHALDMDLFLRIAPELYLKRLLVGGFEKVFEFTTNFRNEGMDRDHNPEFSALEWYAAYKDLEWAMPFTEEMFSTVVKAVFGKTAVVAGDREIDFRAPYRRARFQDLLKEHTGLDYDYADEDTLRAKAAELGIRVEKHATKGILGDEIFKKVICPRLIEPTFVTAWPAEILPLTKRLENSPEYVDAFQFFAGGTELIKSFTELNDPVDQRERFAAQEKNRAKGDEGAQRMDEDFVEALEYGMPPAAGWGLGLDRFVMLLTGAHSVREIILFPTMKPVREKSS